MGRPKDLADRKSEKGNRGDVRKIHVTQQFFDASGHHGDFFFEKKKLFLDKVNGSMCAKCLFCIVVSVASRLDIHK